MSDNTVLPVPVVDHQPDHAGIHTADRQQINYLTGRIADLGDVAAARSHVPLVVFIGESNSGGLAVNTELTAPQLAPRPAVLIWDNDANDGFDVLDIGTNNLRGHAQITAVIDPSGSGQTYDHTRHGWENGLATTAEDGQWNDQVYLLKAGQGGSRLADWDDPTDPYWVTFTTRLAAATASLRAQGLEPDVYVFASIGINDAGSGTSGNDYESRLATWIARIRAAVTSQTGVPHIPVALTRLPVVHVTFNSRIQILADADPLLFPIDVADLTLYSDGAHWNAAAMATMAQRMVTAMLTRVGQGEQYPVALASMTAGPLALLARIEALEAASGGGGGPVVMRDVTWTNLVDAVVDAGGGVLNRTNGDVDKGGMSATAGPTAGFEAIMYVTDAATSDGAVLILESPPVTVDAYDFSELNYLGNVFQYAGAVYANQGPTGAATPITGLTFPAVLRLRADGDDLVAEASTDDGATWTTARTFAAALAGITEITPKVVFALGGSGGSPGAGPKSVRVRAKVAAP